jgi:hypothetical protein
MFGPARVPRAAVLRKWRRGRGFMENGGVRGGNAEEAAVFAHS